MQIAEEEEEEDDERGKVNPISLSMRAYLFCPIPNDCLVLPFFCSFLLVFHK